MDERQLIDIVNAAEVKVKLLAINGSPRLPRLSRSQVLLEDAKAGAAGVGGVEFLNFSFSRKEIAPCRMCIQYCSKNQECTVKDDFQEFRQKWLEADGIIWSVPVYHMGPPSQVRAALDRMNELRFQTSHGHGQKQYPRLHKAVGTIVQGGSRFGGQEITLQFFLHHAMLLQCIPVSSDMPESYLGVAGQTRTMEGLLEDEETRRLSHIIGQRVAEMAKIVKAGMMLTQDSLPDEYFPSRNTMGLIERHVIE